ncbi:MAG: heavy metal translocating P-type ATPase [Treponema sp.]|jgi:Cu2+-exporting ATPase|nr:heavy metal translocating P-type ATPase [Treponema sp.]
MRVAVVHELPGRVRFRANPDALRRYNTAGTGLQLSELRGVKKVVISPRTGSILILYDIEAVSKEELFNFLKGLAPSPDLIPKKRGEEKDSLAWSYIGYQLFRIFRPPALKPLFTILGAVPFFIAGLKSLVKFKIDVPLLDASAIAVSLAQGNINSASTLMMLLKTGRYLEAWAKRRSRENLASGLSLNVGQLWVRKNGRDEQVPYSQIQAGDAVVLRAGALIPVDGQTLEGRAVVNEAALTGEPLGVEKQGGSAVHAGTVIEEGEILVEVRKKGEDTRYERIIRLIEESEAAKAGTEIRAMKIADRAVPFSFAAAAMTAFLTGSPQKAASVDYSCAIKLATPPAFISAVREGLANGVFFKGGAPMEALAQADVIVFDKTGTLTKAAPAVDRIIAYHGFSERKVLKIAACLEEHFPHPVAKAVVADAVSQNVRHREEHSTVKYIAAHGIATAYRGKHTVIGSRHFIGEDEGIDLNIAKDAVAAAEREGSSVLYLAQEGKLAGILIIKDPLRDEAAEVAVMLRKLGVKKIYLLSGDSNSTAQRIVQALSLDGGRGGLLPADKMFLVRELKEKGCKAAFVRDGMNDSPAMSAADVGIAMRDGADLAACCTCGFFAYSCKNPDQWACFRSL